MKIDELVQESLKDMNESQARLVRDKVRHIIEEIFELEDDIAGKTKRIIKLKEDLLMLEEPKERKLEG